MISGIAHINLTIPQGTLDQAEEFYGTTLGLTSAPVPELQKGTILWFNIGSSGQQVHITHGATDPQASRHPCFKLPSREELEEIKTSIYNHHVRGGPAAPMAADKPGEANSGTQGKEYPTRFFARDFGGNLLEFTM
ncbi:hypothetical protein DTO013E5_4246 [Penicillium roqueforti]|uniref:Genomic scaffold, ProqFM164S01 n=1 Tax=Penicillium roqueforti (strain FM164) TaxID=1365484 RepID=W6PS61_PENRF|nr:uncharacterized protein LCP9604111_4232 [Penicillium roqueforti]XP_057040891.1 uncharacterized protein N7518_008261 [Penicillium psychrosexuale]CDM27058.1 unnamed protein product [Penicillium roqueforti FM164]KAF9249603.1 hypothetical protein LCP9604111_4232 [Penicillium roqueforti]KAI1835144.1 hypothetical protein CBS147337_3961 [Penicillium roqueforti]KAI2677157.1 hypothetical protein CBS147355_5384 [Penicillium roqueforti]KAI2688545.1 hypothetical protein LCP963914a_2947 [Penicillium ro